MSNVHADTSENFHPYECDGEGRCRHCDRRVSDTHDPSTCALCDPDYDYAPNPHWGRTQGEAIPRSSGGNPKKGQVICES